jgi:DNA repair protein RecO (recombination protein O)
MSLVTSEAILLRSHPYSDSSRILRFLTRDRGVVSLMGKGVKARGSRGSAALESFAEGVVTFYHRPDRDLHTLKDFERTSGPLGLGQDLRRLAGASLVAEILLTHALEEPDADIYDWVRTAIRRLGTVAEEEIAAWALSAVWRTLAHLGFDPELARCVACGRDLDEPAEDEMGRFDTAAGGIRCPACSKGSELPRVGPRARSELVRLVRGDPPPLGTDGVRGHLRILEGFAVHHIAPGRGFKSTAVVRAAFGMEGPPP